MGQNDWGRIIRTETDINNLNYQVKFLVFDGGAIVIPSGQEYFVAPG